MKHRIWLIALAATTACKSSKPPPAQGTGDGDAAIVDALAPIDAAGPAEADAGAIDGGIDAIPALESGAPAAAPGTFLLVWERPDGIMLVIPDNLKTPPPTKSDGVLRSTQHEYRANDYHIVRHLGEGAPAELTALTGKVVVLHGDKGRVCEATLGEPLVLRGGQHRAKNPSQEALWTGGKEASVQYTYVAFPLATASGPCQKALFAVPSGPGPKPVPLKPAKDWQGDLEAEFDTTDTHRMAEEKVALEGVEGINVVSARKLVGESGRSLGLLYLTIHGERRIAVFSVAPGAAFADAKEVDVIYAASPSVVVGFDADRDGNVDAIVGHKDGITLVRSSGESTDLPVVEGATVP